MQHSGKSSSRSSKKPPTLKELEKYVTDSRTILEEHKADLKSIRYEIVNKLIEFTKFGQSLAAEKQNTSSLKSDREQRIEKLEIQLKQTAEDIEKKEALENDILEAYYTTRTIYMKNHQRWRTAAYREIIRLRSEGKTADSPEMQTFTTKLLIKGDDNTSEFEKRTTTEWRGQMLSEKNVFFDIETGKLGQGAFGAVYKGRVFHSECAIKVLSSKHMTDTAKEEFKAEVITLSNLQHDRVLRFLGAVLDDKRMMLVTELCANGSMADRLFPPLAVKKSNNNDDDDDDDDDYEDRPRKPVAGKKKKTYYTLSPKKKLAIFRGIIEGMIFLHEHKIVHYDLKPENILLDEEFNPVIADFGLARILNIEDVLGMSSGMGTPFYMAPEMLTTPVQLSPKCDIYAFGFIAWELWTQERNEWKDCVTGGGVNTSTLHGIIKSGKRPSLERPDIPFPETMKNIISKCWDFDPNKRPDFKYLQFIIKNNPDVLEKAIRWTALKDNLRDSAGSGRKTQEMMELERVLINLSNDAFFAIYEEIIGSEVKKNEKTWDEIVKKIVGIKDGEKCDAIPILWDKFVVEYPKILGIPEFKAEEQILFRIFMIQEDATNQSAVVTKRDFKCGPGTGVLSCPLADMSSMDSLSLLRFFKDKNSVLKKIIAVAPEKAGKNQWHEVKPVFRPDSLTFAVAELKEIKEMRNKLKKKGKADSDVKTKSHNVGMYVFGISNDDEDDEGVNTTYAKNELDNYCKKYK